jgi:hypothetical protein
VQFQRCPHLRAINEGCYATPLIAPELVQFGASCQRGCAGSENWQCLQCGQTHCSRYVHGHALVHHGECAHPTAISLSDLSVWCFDCDAYVTDERLRPLVGRMRALKFGDEGCPPAGAPDAPLPPVAEDDEEGDADEKDEKDAATDDALDAEAGAVSPPSTSAHAQDAAVGAMTDAFAVFDVSDAPADERPPPAYVSGQAVMAVDAVAAADVSDPAPSPSAPLPPLPQHRDLERFAGLIRDAPPSSIIVLVGAGASVSAGIPDFRTPGTGACLHVSHIRPWLCSLRVLCMPACA